mgnify:CR=1 FL=1
MRATSSRSLPLALGLLALLLVSPPSLGGNPGEVSFDVRMDSGDYGTGTSSDTQSALLRYARGDRFRIRLDLPFLRVESSEGVARSFFGTVALEDGQGRRQGSGTAQGTQSGGPESLAPVDEAMVPPESAWESGVGDVRLGASARLVGGGVKVFRADAIVDLKAPTADEDKGLGTGEWDLRAGLGAEYRFWSSTGFAGAGYTRHGDPSWIDLEDVADVYAGIESDPLRGRYVLSAWLEAQDEVVPGVGERSALGVGLRVLGRTRYRVLATVGLSDAAEDFSIGLGVSIGAAGPGAGRKGSQR